MTYYYHSIVDSPHLPRELGGDTAQASIVTLLGEFWPQQDPPPAPSAAIVELLGRLGVTEAAVRAALSRLSRRGTLDAFKVGRTTSYRLSDDVRASIPASELLTMSFGAADRAWDGGWTVVVFSVPEAQRERRDLLREWLRWLGFGPLRDGVWISPRASVDFVAKSLVDVLPADGLIFRTSYLVGEIQPDAIWPLGQLRQVYDEFLGEFRPTVYQLRGGATSPTEALRLSLRLIGRWRGFPAVDPDLPRDTLPSDWPRDESRRLFANIYDAALPLAATWVRRVVARYDPAAAASVRVLSVDEATAEFSRAAPAPADEIDLNALGPARLRSTVSAG